MHGYACFCQVAPKQLFVKVNIQIVSKSDVPQGSVIRPMLFSVFINDLPTKVQSDVHLFADDCILYRQIRNGEDTFSLQNGLDEFQEWCKEWLMHLHPDKYEILRVTNKCKPLKSICKVDGHILDVVSSKKNLGITLQSSLSWNTHVDLSCSNTYSTIGLLRRSMSNCPCTVKSLCYNSLVGPILEFSSTIWDPHTARNINRLEMVQRQSTRYVFSDYHRTSSSTEMMSSRMVMAS